MDATKEVLYKLHWYKEIKGKDERRRIYRILRNAGLPAELARRVRDWSNRHIEAFIISNPHLFTVEVEELINAIRGDGHDGEDSYRV